MHILKSSAHVIDFLLMYGLLRLLAYLSDFLPYKHPFEIAFIVWIILAWVYVGWRKQVRYIK